MNSTVTIGPSQLAIHIPQTHLTAEHTVLCKRNANEIRCFSFFVLAKIRRNFATNFRQSAREFSLSQTKFRCYLGEISFWRKFAFIWWYFHKAKFRSEWKWVVMKTLCSDRCVCCTCTCDCFKRSLQIESSSMLVIVKLTLVKELTEKRKMNVEIFIFSILCDISERDKQYMTKYANNE